MGSKFVLSALVEERELLSTETSFCSNQATLSAKALISSSSVIKYEKEVIEFLHF